MIWRKSVGTFAESVGTCAKDKVLHGGKVLGLVLKVLGHVLKIKCYTEEKCDTAEKCWGDMC